jgi:hypothetical protein
MHNTISAKMIGAVALLMVSFTSQAAPTLFGSDYYEFVKVSNPFTGNNNSWFTASTAAAASVYKGVHGNLVNITSKEENSFLFGLVPPGSFSGFAGAWLGGKAPEGWLVGPEARHGFNGFSYTNWGGIEPNNNGYIFMNIGNTFAGISPSQWADDSGVQGVPDRFSDPVVGYFVQYHVTAVPEPDEYAMLLLGFGLVGFQIKHKQSNRVPNAA